MVQLLKQYGYDHTEIDFINQGFSQGFDIGYQGPKVRTSTANNLPFTVGNEIELWNKLMKEVKLNRVAGPFDSPPFINYIQSLIGLVPKVGTDKTRLIFHLSYQFKQEPKCSLNTHTPKHLCSVKYNDVDHAIKTILQSWENAQAKQTNSNLTDTAKVRVVSGKTDAQSAFRILPLSVSSTKWTVMKAHDPLTKIWKYFVNKCLPFGVSISCALFQRFSNALKFWQKKGWMLREW